MAIYAINKRSRSRPDIAPRHETASHLTLFLQGGEQNRPQKGPKKAPKLHLLRTHAWNIFTGWHNEPVHADGDEVEDGGGGADDVHGDVHVAEEERQRPQIVDLKQSKYFLL